MDRYNYKFTWNEKVSRKYQRKYIEATSKQAAIEIFEKEFGLNVHYDHIEVVRLKGDI